MPNEPPDPLASYRAKRDPTHTPEPVPPRRSQTSTPRDAAGDGARFVVQEHHARALHWDLRLERDGVLVSWAVPKGVPVDKGQRRLAVQTEDHPLEYATFAGDIPAGEYGGGTVSVWDSGTYTCEKWNDREVLVELAGNRLSGRYALVRTGGKNWIVQRRDPAVTGRSPMPDRVPPMLATPGELPRHDEQWSFEFKWDGVRAMAYVEGGRARLLSRNDRDVTASYPELRHAFEALGSRDTVLDGEVVAFGADGRPDFGTLQRRMHVADEDKARKLAHEVPVAFLAFDLVHLDGADLGHLSYHQRRAALEGLALAGPHVAVPPVFAGPGAQVLRAAQEQGLEGVVAKRLDSPYRAGRRSTEWVKVKVARYQEVVIVGWAPGRGRRADTIGALLLALPGDDGRLIYAGRVGTGFTRAALEDIALLLTPLERDTSPLPTPIPAQAGDAHWVEPRLVGEVRFGEWTADGRLRHPSWRGLRPDKNPRSVRREGLPLAQ